MLWGYKYCFAVLAEADRCLQTISQQKLPLQKRKKAREEVSFLFNKKFKKTSSKKCSWKHKFVCLSSHIQECITTKDVDKDNLFRAGLGEKEIEFHDMHLDGTEFRDLLYEAYPKLKDGGGFQFLKCAPNSRCLELLSSTTLSSPAILKSRVGNARTYIRPIQRDLDLSFIADLPQGVSSSIMLILLNNYDCFLSCLLVQPKERCLECGELFEIEILSEHVSQCCSRCKIMSKPKAVLYYLVPFP